MDSQNIIHTVTVTRVPWGYNGLKWPKPEGKRTISAEDAAAFVAQLPPAHARCDHDQQHVIRFPDEAVDIHVMIVPPIPQEG